MSFRDQIQETIEKYGLQIIGVGGQGQPSFSYTIGLTAKFGYELLVCGLPSHIAHSVLNTIALDGTVELDVPTTKFTNLPLLFKETDMSLGKLHDQYVCQADNFYGKEVTVVQIILSDRQGRTPNDDTYDHEYMDKFQPLFVDFTKR